MDILNRELVLKTLLIVTVLRKQGFNYEYIANYFKDTQNMNRDTFEELMQEVDHVENLNG